MDVSAASSSAGGPATSPPLPVKHLIPIAYACMHDACTKRQVVWLYCTQHGSAASLRQGLRKAGGAAPPMQQLAYIAEAAGALGWHFEAAHLLIEDATSPVSYRLFLLTFRGADLLAPERGQRRALPARGAEPLAHRAGSTAQAGGAHRVGPAHARATAGVPGWHASAA